MNLREVTGVIDGANRDFATPTGYVALSLRVLLNGRIVARDHDDGYDEQVPAVGAFRMKIAPIVGDTLFAFYEEV